jgi:CBS domain-containing protein
MPENTNIRDLITDKFKIMNEEELLSKAIGVFNSEKPEVIVVVDKENNYKGILSERWIYRAMVDPSKTKIKALCKYVPEVFRDASLIEVAKRMLESNTQVAPILNREGDVVGVIKDIDLLAKVVEEEFGDLNVIEFATTELITLSKNDSIGKVLAIFRENNISRAPILDNGKVVGIVTMHDIITKFVIPRDKASKGELRGEKIHSTAIPVEEIMSSPVIYVGLKGKTREAIELMKEYDISDVLIIENDKLLGIITKKDLLEAYVKFGKVEKGFVIQLVGDYELIDEFDRLKILRDLNNFASKLERILGSGSIVLRFKKLRGEEGRRYLVRMRLLSPGKTYHVKYEGFNALDTVQIILDKMDRVVISEKEHEDDERLKEYFKQRLWL